MRYALLFLLVALLVVLPWLFTPGYLFLLDWQGVPNISPFHLDQTGGLSGAPVQLFLYVLAAITSSAFAQKFLLFLILATIGYATARLTKTLLPENTPPVIPYIAGLFAILNPFVYNRIQMGHVYLLAGYALTPFAIIATLHFVRTPTIRRALVASFVSSIVIASSIHHVIVLPLILVCFIWITWKPERIQPIHYIAGIVPFLCTAAILLVSTTTSISPIHAISTQDLFFFAPVKQCTQSLILDTSLLAAQWRNSAATHASCSSPKALIAGVLLIGIMIFGSINNKKLFLASLLFATLAIVPLIPAMRDSAKFLAPLALLESILLAHGALYVSNIKKYSELLVLALVCIAGLPLLWGLSGTIIPRDYPESWYHFNNAIVSSGNEKHRVLFLPWHLYMPFDFTNHETIGNPAMNFFTNAHVTQGDNLEIQQGGKILPTQSTRQISKNVESTLAQRDTPAFSEALRQLLTQEDIGYVALAHGSIEQEPYQAAFTSMSFLEKDYDAPGLTVWRYTQ